MLDGQFLRRNNAFGLVADIEQDFVPIDLDYCAFDDVAIVKVLDGFVNGSNKLFLGTNIVDGNLGSSVVRGHRVGDSELIIVSNMDRWYANMENIQAYQGPSLRGFTAQ